MTEEFTSADLLARYEGLCELADRHADDGWRSTREDGEKRGILMPPEILDRFADHVIGGIGFEWGNDFFDETRKWRKPPALLEDLTPEQASGYKAATVRAAMGALRSMKPVAPLDYRTLAILLQIDGVVGGRSITFDLPDQPKFPKIRISHHTARVAPRALHMQAVYGHIPGSVLEIGGGHGRFVRDVAKLSRTTRIYYVDLVFNLLIAARYLTRVFPGQVHLAWEDDQDIPINRRIVLLPPWRIKDLPLVPDICCNFLSFQHMEAENLRYYGDQLEAIGVGSIFHLNRIGAFHDKEVELSADRFGPRWRQAQRLELSRSQMRNAKGEDLGSAPVVREVLVHADHLRRFRNLVK